jgi:hypothetical protein
MVLKQLGIRVQEKKKKNQTQTLHPSQKLIQNGSSFPHPPPLIPSPPPPPPSPAGGIGV